jgi:hypothetical protein
MKHDWKAYNHEDHAMKCSICGEVICFFDRDHWFYELEAECEDKTKYCRNRANTFQELYIKRN